MFRYKFIIHKRIQRDTGLYRKLKIISIYKYKKRVEVRKEYKSIMDLRKKFPRHFTSQMLFLSLAFMYENYF